ncbi:hypothetical protein [Pedobacter endophyticus]|uniref:Uncharacterized protein n=1 Tax=Pedobacter endophyticus TaxID=2789740 RepID=A0A7S9KZD6_9SPHI|nr:hypothetical protein [Pedobacter endophyticus]QPH39409.1 hypothetical protein IZT61_20595 [Pedobacter endophyticus]
MDSSQEQLNALKDIREMMDRSSRFISLSGLSGVFAGVIALIGAYFAQVEIDKFKSGDVYRYGVSGELDLEYNLIKLAFIILFVALAGGILFTYRKSQRSGLPIWDKTFKSLIINLFVPIVAGGLFIIALLVNHPNTYSIIAPTCLIFYGLGLVNASKYTFSDIKYLGYLEIILGLICMFNVGYGLIFWAFGFGILHIIYGLLMYFKYEKGK